MHAAILHATGRPISAMLVSPLTHLLNPLTDSRSLSTSRLSSQGHPSHHASTSAFTHILTRFYLPAQHLAAAKRMASARQDQRDSAPPHLAQCRPGARRAKTCLSPHFALLQRLECRRNLAHRAHRESQTPHCPRGCALQYAIFPALSRAAVPIWHLRLSLVSNPSSHRIVEEQMTTGSMDI